MSSATEGKSAASGVLARVGDAVTAGGVLTGSRCATVLAFGTADAFVGAVGASAR